MPRLPSSPERKRAVNAWRVMKRRCLEPGFRDFPRYGGAGIKVCPQWVASFDRFLADVGLPPSPKHWLGRKDTSKHYTPENCTWTEPTPQKQRRQFCRKVIVQGQTLTAAEASRLPGQPTRNTVLRRWEAGFSLEQPRLAKLYKRSMWLTYQGETLPLPEWARRFGLPSSTVWQRIRRGVPISRAFSPLKRSRAANRSSPAPTNKP